jgi:hypothetical protein
MLILNKGGSKRPCTYNRVVSTCCLDIASRGWPGPLVPI